ncbi:MAG: hypothetical protein AMXMBFR56_77010 [Polyangiaceae bacterium]
MALTIQKTTEHTFPGRFRDYDFAGRIVDVRNETTQDTGAPRRA